MKEILFEACVDSVEAALAAEAAGADRLELCAALELGGVTPSPGLIQMVCERVSIPVQVLVRPRPGNFVYSQLEVEVICQDVEWMVGTNASGVVVGALDENGALDLHAIRQIADRSSLPLTFHRAFDHAGDLFKGASQLIDLGFERILTSGGKPTALAGIPTLKRLNQFCGDKITIMPGGGINPENIKEIHQEVDFKEVHFSAVKPRQYVSKGPEVGKVGGVDSHLVPFPGKITEIKNQMG